jgi:growth arrest-specific protein 8
LRKKSLAWCALGDEKARIAELNKEKRALKIEISNKELAAQDFVKSIKEDNLKEAAMLQQDIDEQARKLRHNYEKSMKSLRNELGLRRKLESHEIEERKNSHNSELIKEHEKAFGEIKNYL